MLRDPRVQRVQQGRVGQLDLQELQALLVPLDLPVRPEGVDLRVLPVQLERPGLVDQREQRAPQVHQVPQVQLARQVQRARVDRPELRV